LNIITGQSGNPTYSQDIAEAVLRFIQRDSKGIFNVAGSFLADRYNIALETARAISLDSSLISPVPSSSLVQKAERPESGGLTNIKTLREIDFAPSDLQTGIKNMLDCE
jgi:dTDP-4-dehydrorhamnose reductase